MKKIFICLIVALSATFSQSLNAQCGTVTTEIFPRNPQTGANNYFGVRISIPSTFPVDITVSGYIYDEGSPDTNHPFTLTITAGNTSAETADDYYETGPATSADGSVNSTTPCPAENMIADLSDEYVKRHVAFIDFYVRSISSTRYKREIYFKNYGTTALPSVVGFNTDLFFDDGTHNDLVSGDGIYVSIDSFTHTSTITYTNLERVSALEDYAIKDTLFEHISALNTFLSTYEVPTRDDLSGLLKSNYNDLTQNEEDILEEFTLMSDAKNGPSLYSKEDVLGIQCTNMPYNLTDNSNNIKPFKFKVSLKCDIGSCNCSTCNCRACNYNWGQSLNWCAYVSNCSFEIGFEW